MSLRTSFSIAVLVVATAVLPMSVSAQANAPSQPTASSRPDNGAPVGAAAQEAALKNEEKASKARLAAAKDQRKALRAQKKAAKAEKKAGESTQAPKP